MCFWVRIFVYHCLTCWMSFSGLQLPTWLGLLVMASITWDDLCCESTHVENCLNELSPGVSFTFINHYLWNPQPLLVQYIGNINKFLWLSVFFAYCVQMHLNLYTWKKPIWNYLVCLLLVFHRYLQCIHWPIANNCIYFCLQSLQ